MLTVKTPELYISEPGALKKAGEVFGKYGKKVYIIGGKTALEKTWDTLEPSLKNAGIRYQIAEYEGYPTEANAGRHAAAAKEYGADLIAAVGGGRVCDTAKIAAAQTGLPCVTVPTIAATCAAWAALSIVYDDRGKVLYAAFHQKCPKAVIADARVILEAPVRYIRAGIIDTLAKWYETAPNLAQEYGDLTLRVNIGTAKAAYETLTEHIDDLIQQLDAHEITPLTQNAVDAIIYLAGLSGSLTSQNFYGGFAHGFYNSVTQLPETAGYLHGERVAVGLLTQFILEGKDREFLDREIGYFIRLKQPVTLAQIGITEAVQEKLDAIVPDIVKFVDFVPFLKENQELNHLDKIIRKADQIGSGYLQKGQYGG